MKLRTGDTVVVISGKDKGKTGTIMRVFASEGRIVVTGLNMRTRHVKKTTQGPGRILHYEASLAASKVMIIDPKSKKRARIGFKVDLKGKKVRISKESGDIIVKVKAAKMKKETVAKIEGDKKEKKDKKAQMEEGATSAKPKQPFWKKMKFGAAALEQAENEEGTHMQEDHTIPAQELHIRKGSRGS